MANQFDRRGPPERIKKHHDEATKDKIRAEVLSKRLEKYAKAKGKQIEKYRMEPAQVQACKVLIDRGKPMLQAIQQTVTNEYENMTEQQMYEHVKALILANPQLIRQFAPGPSLSNSPVAEHQSGDMTLNNTKEAA